MHPQIRSDVSDRALALQCQPDPALDQLLEGDRVDSQYRSVLTGCDPQVVPAVLRVSVNVQIHSYLDFRKSSG